MTNGQVVEGSIELNYILLLDVMGERYGCLPSEILEKGSTLDLFVYDAAASYRAAKERESRGARDPVNISTEELLKKMEKFKNAKN